MNKVLVVDDEKLVRQGIITTFPWGRHGFEVACDAGGGEKALELLAREDIDLLVTDLAMNGMSGLELIKRARKIREDLPVVILTCHDNFKYIQEAMRLGVLDYIVKTEIEDEVVDETLMRIAGKLESGKKTGRGAATGDVSEGPAQEGLLLCGPARSSAPVELLGLDNREGWIGRLAEVDAATWLLRVNGAEANRLMARISAALETGSWTCVRISGIGNDDGQAAIAKLKGFRRRVLFYRPADPVQVWEWTAISEAKPYDDETVARIRNDWNAPEWVYSDDRFESLLRRTAEAGMDAGELRNMLYPAALEWERLLDSGALKTLLVLADDWLYWREWESWLRGFRNEIRRTVGRNATRHIADTVFRAIELMRSAIDSEASEADIAKAVNMSRGHFSKSFKRVTGKSYGEYVRLIKLERAKEMILRTDEPITRVAESCGFSDYRHFSRVFRDYTGKLPTDFRKAGSVE